MAGVVGNKYDDLARQIMEEQMMQQMQGKQGRPNKAGPVPDQGNAGYSGVSQQTLNETERTAHQRTVPRQNEAERMSNIQNRTGQADRSRELMENELATEPMTVERAWEMYDTDGSEVGLGENLYAAVSANLGGEEALLAANPSEVTEMMGFSSNLDEQELNFYMEMTPENRREVWQEFIQGDGLATLGDAVMNVVGGASRDTREGMKPTPENPG